MESSRDIWNSKVIQTTQHPRKLHPQTGALSGPWKSNLRSSQLMILSQKTTCVQPLHCYRRCKVQKGKNSHVPQCDPSGKLSIASPPQPCLSGSHRDPHITSLAPHLSYRTAAAQKSPFQPPLDLKFANREMTKTPRTRPKMNWEILKATGTVQYKPTYARPTKEKLVQTKKKWDL